MSTKVVALAALCFSAAIIACTSDDTDPSPAPTNDGGDTMPSTAMSPDTAIPTMEPIVSPSAAPIDTATPTMEPAVTPAQDPAPEPPTGVAAGGSGGSGEIAIRWSANPEADVVSYNVHRSDVSGGPYSLIASVGEGDVPFLPTGTREYIDTGRIGTSCYVVSSVDAAGNESDFSNESCAAPNP